MKTISICGTIILCSIVLITVSNKNSLTPLDQEDKMITERSICKSCQDENDMEWIIQDKDTSEISDCSSSDQKVKVIRRWVICGSGEEELDFDWGEQVGRPTGALLLDSSP